MPETELVTGSTHAPGEVHKFPCKQCGADLAFSPGQTVLACSYCGYREEIPVTREAILEYDLEDALLRAPKVEGWGTERRAVGCESCGAVTTFDPAQVAGQCAFCGSSRVIDREATGRLIRPESLVPFQVTREQAVTAFRRWIAGGWFRPNNLKHAGNLAGINGAYLPFWTYDAFTSAWWTAEAGYHYYETEYYEETDAQGNRVQRSRQVQKTRWVPASGQRQDFFDDELVCGSLGLTPRLLAGISPFDLGGLQPYQSSFLAGFAAEEYQVDLGQGWERARESIEGKVYSLCAGDVPGDTHRNLQVNTAFSQMTFKHLLLPVWIAAYRYQDRAYRFMVNGQTGKAAGEAPVSWWKVAAAVLAGLLVALVIFLLVRSHGG